MAAKPGIALQGRSRGLLSPLLLCVAVHITTSGIPALAADDQAACSTPFARIVSIQGSVEVLRADRSGAGPSGAGPGDASGWLKVTRLDTALCEGDRLRTGALSRAALFIQPETLVRVDQHTRISLSQTAEETLVEFMQDELRPASATANACGAGYFITRFPRKFKVNTPHLNAAVEGTEFLVAMRCEATDLSVFEGKVLAASAGTDVFPPQTISSGQTLTIGGAEPPAIKLLVKPADAVQWVLYYPPLSDARAEAELPSADQCRSLPKPLDQTCLSQRAELLMRLGQIDQAQQEIDEAVALYSRAGEANALRAVILIARNDKTGALEAATNATTAAPNAYRSWLALSYAQQAAFKLDDALESARTAQALEPNSSLTNARVAELLMSLGRIREAERAAQAAVDANPAESRARTVLGFVRLAQIKTKVAREDFQAAIERDSSDPLPRLGLGLTIIRGGNLVVGREQLEIAVALDPTNSLLRSYVGKAYYEENTKERDQLAASQFGLAKQIDPNDPTPWFYEGILEQTRNMPVRALNELHESIERNSSRAIYRSQLSLDQDLAARTISSARIHRDLGFEQLGLIEAVDSLAIDPANYSAQRFLSDVYAGRPRHEISRVSSLLQSQLRQPLWSGPRAIEMSDDRPTGVRTETFRDIAPIRTEVNDYLPLLYRDRLSLNADGLLGDRDTSSRTLTASGLHNRVSWSIGESQLRTDGFPKVGASEKTVQSLFGQATASFGTSVQLEYRRLAFDRTETFFSFDPALAFSSEVQEDTNNLRIGAYHPLSANADLLLSIISQSRKLDGSFAGLPPTRTLESDGVTAEFQNFMRLGSLTAITGIGRFKGEDDFVVADFSENVTHDNLYLYGGWNEPIPHLNLQLGFSADSLARDDTRVRRVHPKLGAIWGLGSRITLRAATFSSIKRQLIGNQTIEPTQVAGFNQFFDDPNGTISRRSGIGLDYRFGVHLFAGLEVTSRNLDVPVFSTLAIDWFEWRERSELGYLYWTVPQQYVPGTWSAALSTHFEREKFERPEDFTGMEGFHDVTTWYVPISLTAFNPMGFSFRITSSYVNQDGVLISPLNRLTVEEEAWVTSVSLGYRLPRRHGRITVGISNITNRQLNYQESDPRTPRFAPERFMYARLSLEF